MLRGENPEYGQREIEDHAAKIRIAAGVAALLQDRRHVWLDSGTTATEVARQLRQRDMTLMPMSLRAVNALTDGGPGTGRHPELLLPGGRLIAGELSFRGPMAESNIRSLRFDTAVLTPCALNLDDGLLAHDLDDAAVKRAGLESAGRVIVACSGSKWNASAVALVDGAGVPFGPGAGDDHPARGFQAGALYRCIVEVVGQQSVPEVQRAGRHNGRVKPQRTDVGFRHGPAEGQFPGGQAPAGQEQFGTPACSRAAVGNRVDSLQRHRHQGHFPLPQLAGHLRGRRAAVQPDVAAVLEQGGDAGRNPHLDGMVLELALAVLGVLAAQDETPGTAVDASENSMELQYIQVPPDRGTRGATFGHELIDLTCSRCRNSSPMRRCRSSVLMYKC